MPLLWLSTVFVAGILIADLLSLPWPAWMGLALACILALIALRRVERVRGLPPVALRLAHSTRAVPLPLLALLAATALGGMRLALARPAITPAHVAWYNDQGPVAVRGVVDAPPDRRDTALYLKLRVTQITPGNAQGNLLPEPVKAHGWLLLKLPAGGEPGGGWQYGDVLTGRALLTEPPESGDFSYKDYLARQNIYAYATNPQLYRAGSGQGSWFYRGLYRFKDRALAVTRAIFPPPENELMAGILLGVDAGIPANIQQAFKDTGTAHIVAISGFNIAILAGLFTLLFGRLLGGRRGALAAAVAITLYTLLVGASASVVRAAIMGWIGLLAGQVGRRQAGLNSLAATAALMCLANPWMPWDVGFQLSFMATLGLVLFAGPLTAAFEKLAGHYLSSTTARRVSQPVGDYFLLTLAAQITTLPVILYHFGRLSLGALIANPLVLPVQPAVMLLGGLALLLGLVDGGLGQAAALLATPFAAFTTRAVEALAKFAGLNLNLGSFSLGMVVAAYALLAWLAFVKDKRAWLKRLAQPAPALMALGAVTVLTWSMALHRPDGSLRVMALPGDAGEAVLISAPGGSRVLIGAGERGSLAAQALGRRLPPQDRRLDVLWLAADGKSALQAAPVLLQSIRVDQALWSLPEAGTQAARDAQQALLESGVPIQAITTGSGLDLAGGARLTLLAQSAHGALLALEWVDFRAVIVTGAPPLAEFEGLPASPLHALILPAAFLSDERLPALIEQARAQWVVISGSPAKALPACLSGARTLTTGDIGWVEIRTDGQQMWVEAEKQE